MKTLQQILIDANAYLDLEAAEPTGSELTTRSNYANQAVWDASAVAQFSELHTNYVVPTLTNSTITLPSNFKELMNSPQVLEENGQWTGYEEIDAMERYSKSSSDKYCYVMGNPAEGYRAIFNNLTANATLSFDYQRFPSGLLTLADMCELSDPMYVVAKIESYVLQSRSDDRFPQVEAEASRRLMNMVGRESKVPGGGINTTKKTGIANYRIS